LNRTSDCTINRCGKPHHKMLHKAFKDEEEARKPPGDARCKLKAGLCIDPESVRPEALEKAAKTDSRRELLMGLGIDPDTMEVRTRPHEPERGPGGGTLARMAGGEER
jgi:hypothetical protein